MWRCCVRRKLFLCNPMHKREKTWVEGSKGREYGQVIFLALTSQIAEQATMVRHAYFRESGNLWSPMPQAGTGMKKSNTNTQQKWTQVQWTMRSSTRVNICRTLQLHWLFICTECVGVFFITSRPFPPPPMCCWWRRSRCSRRRFVSSTRRLQLWKTSTGECDVVLGFITHLLQF